MSNKANLDDRIARVLTTRTPSSDVAALLSEVESEAAAAVTAADSARAQALDPKRAGAEVTAARTASEQANFARDRLAVATASLGEKLVLEQRHEEDERRDREYKAFRGKCEGLADELAAAEPRVIAFARLLAEIQMAERHNTGALPGANIISGSSPFFRTILASDSFVADTLVRAVRQLPAEVISLKSVRG
jgi:hypothetical protein